MLPDPAAVPELGIATVKVDNPATRPQSEAALGLLIVIVGVPIVGATEEGRFIVTAFVVSEPICVLP